MSSNPSTTDAARTAVWPLWTRLIHWGVAGACAFNLWLSEEGEAPHRRVGLSAAALVLVRLLLGARSGLPELRIRPLLTPVSTLRQQLGELFSRRRLPATRGHSPLAGPVMLGIWTMVLALAASGWVSDLDVFFGEEWVLNLHEVFGRILMLLIGAHLAGLAFESLTHRTAAWKAMIDGKKKQP